MGRWRTWQYREMLREGRRQLEYDEGLDKEGARHPGALLGGPRREEDEVQEFAEDVRMLQRLQHRTSEPVRVSGREPAHGVALELGRASIQEAGRGIVVTRAVPVCAPPRLIKHRVLLRRSAAAAGGPLISPSIPRETTWL